MQQRFGIRMGNRKRARRRREVAAGRQSRSCALFSPGWCCASSILYRSSALTMSTQARSWSTP